MDWAIPGTKTNLHDVAQSFAKLLHRVGEYCLVGRCPEPHTTDKFHKAVVQPVLPVTGGTLLFTA